MAWGNSNIFSDTLSISDNVNGSWTTAIAGNHSVLLTSMIMAFFWNAASGFTPTVTLHGTTGTNASITITEYLGVMSSGNPSDGTPSQAQVSAGAGNNPDSGAINTTTTGLVCGFGTMFPTDHNAMTFPYFEKSTSSSLTYPASVADGLNATAGTNDAIWLNGDSTYWIAMACGFKPVGSTTSGITAVGSSGGFGGGLKTPAVGSAARRRYFLPEHRV